MGISGSAGSNLLQIPPSVSTLRLPFLRRHPDNPTQGPRRLLLWRLLVDHPQARRQPLPGRRDPTLLCHHFERPSHHRGGSWRSLLCCLRDLGLRSYVSGLAAR